MKLIICYVFIILSILFQLQGQHLVNNGNGIVVNEGAWLVIGGNYINLHGGQNGFIDIDGKMVVYGDFINNASNNVFINIENTPDGQIILNNPSVQNISGLSPAYFENLILRQGRKVLQTDQCKVFGTLQLNAIFDLNKRTFIIDNPSSSAISYVSGYILSETFPADGLGIIRWNIQNNTGHYAVPFGSGLASGNDLHLTLQLHSPGDQNGFVNFATYPTSSDNYPYPPVIGSLNPFSPDVTVDRFWYIEPNFSTKPSASIIFQYDNHSARNLNEQTLKAIRYNNNTSTWNDWGPDGICNPQQNTVTTSIFSGEQFYAWWTLTGEERDEYIYIPNAFSPNTDNHNELFKPSFSGYEPEVYEFYIFDRWGDIYFYTKDIHEGWNGNIGGKPAPVNVYVWLLKYSDINGKEKTLRGIVTLIR